MNKFYLILLLVVRLLFFMVQIKFIGHCTVFNEIEVNY